MPTAEEMEEVFGEVPKAMDGSLMDPRLYLVMKVQILKRMAPRSETGRIGACALNYHVNTPCTEDEWDEVKRNYRTLMDIKSRLSI